MQLAEKQFIDWSSGIEPEIQFWTNWLKGAQDDPADTLAARLDTARPLQAEIAAFVKELNQAKVAILDVGAGPLSWLGRKLADVDVSIAATDILADRYADLLAAHEISTDIPTKFAPIEDLSLFFPASSFDIVYCRDALDHSSDPLRGLNEMLRCVRVGGLVIIDSRRNYAEFRDYTGFTQFNIDNDGQKLLIWNRILRVDASTILQVPVNIRVERDGSRAIAVIVKSGEFAAPGEHDHQRARAVELTRIASMSVAQIAPLAAAHTRLRAESAAEQARLRAESEAMKDKIQRLQGEIRRIENVLADERRSALSARQYMTQMEFLLAEKEAGAKLNHDTMKAIAKEVWFEKQRWGLPYKMGKWIKSLSGR